MLWGQAAGAQTVITIEVQENDTAFWTVEKHIPFETQSEMNEWNNIMKGNNTYRSRKDIADFSDNINKSLSSAENYSSRSMRARNFNISYDLAKSLPSPYGIIRYTFEWMNFSRMDSGRILVGDAFSEMMVLSSDNVLVIKIPKGYEVKNATPSFDKQDGNRLIWDRTSSFNRGEPSLDLARKTVVEENGSPVMLIIALVVLFTGGIFILWIKRRSIKDNDAEHTDENNLHHSGMNETKKENNASGNLQELPEDTAMKIDITTLSPDLTREILSDEEMIEQYLVKFGGQAYQSEIVKESGLSKSKISIVLAKMKEEGRILKIRKGKENIIRIVPKNKDAKNQTENSGA